VPVSPDFVEVESVMELIECKHQPGRLRISRHACALRHLMAQKMKVEFPKDEFGMARKAGLDICRTCPDGRTNAKGHQRKAVAAK